MLGLSDNDDDRLNLNELGDREELPDEEECGKGGGERNEVKRGVGRQRGAQ